MILRWNEFYIRYTNRRTGYGLFLNPTPPFHLVLIFFLTKVATRYHSEPIERSTMAEFLSFFYFILPVAVAMSVGVNVGKHAEPIERQQQVQDSHASQTIHLDQVTTTTLEIIPSEGVEVIFQKEITI